MKRKTLLILLCVAGLMFALFLAAQIMETDRTSPASFLPQGALLYAEAENLHDLLSWWKESEIKRHWQQSSNYESFLASRLYLKGKDRSGKWGAAADFQLNLQRLISLSGKKSGLALYDIGNLKAILLTHISPAQAEAGELWAARGRFRQNTTLTIPYFVEPEEGRLCFAYRSPYLVISTEEDLLRKTLSAMEDPAPAAALDQGDKWTSLHAMSPARGVFSLYLDMETLRENRYMKRYWIHRNVSELHDLKAGWISIVVENDRWIEHRYFLPQKEDMAEEETVRIRELAEPLRDLPFETLFAEGAPDALQTSRKVLTFVNRLPASHRKTSLPPLFSGAVEKAGQTVETDKYLQQIDASIPENQSAQIWKADEETQLTALFRKKNLLASIQMSYPSWDQDALFVRFPKTLALRLQDPEGLQGPVLELLKKHFLNLHSTVNLGAEWEELQNGTFVLHSLHPIYLRFQKTWLILSTGEEAIGQVVARLPEGSKRPSGFYAEIKWDSGRWKYSRIMRRLDHGSETSDQPLFFSQNLHSLLNVLGPVHTSTVERNGLQETVTYLVR